VKAGPRHEAAAAPDDLLDLDARLLQADTCDTTEDDASDRSRWNVPNERAEPVLHNKWIRLDFLRGNEIVRVDA